MKNLLITGKQHAVLIVSGLVIVSFIGVNSLVFGFFDETAGFVTVLLAGIYGGGEAIGFIARTTTWQANRLVPGYAKKIWLTSLVIVGAYLTYGLMLSLALGNLRPPFGIAALVALGLVALQIYGNRTGSKSASISITVGACLFLGVITARFVAVLNEQTVLLNEVWVTVSSPIIQIPALTLAVIAAFSLKAQIEMTTSTASEPESPIFSWERFKLNVAGRFSFGGWSNPTVHVSAILLFLIPFFVIVGVSHVSFADEDAYVLSSSASWFSLVAALIIYIGSGTPFGLLKNPGMWLGTVWRLGLGNSRCSVGRQFAKGISKACIGPGLAVIGVVLLHGFYIESPSVDWLGYANFYDEMLLLFCVNLLGFTWGCASFPTRTMECPQFLSIRVAMCAATCLVFYPGVEFGLLGRVLVCLAFGFCLTLAIYVGGRMISDIDFLPLRKQLNPLSA